MNTCQTCGTRTESSVCPLCGTPIVSVDEDRIDQLVADASVPDLATLMRRAKNAGHLNTAGPEYAPGN